MHSRMSAHKCLVSAIAVGGLMALSIPGHAQEKAEGGLPATLEGLAACKAIPEDAARLACFDRESGELIAAAGTGEVRMVNREEVKKVRRSLFGFSLPKIGLFGRDETEKPEEIEELTSTVVSAQPVGYGKFRIRIEDGDAIWETTESSPTFLQPKRGDKVHIKSGALTSYWLTVNDKRRVRAKRVQ
jgi:hypothetical protein